MPLSIARTSSVPPVISTKEESFFLNFFAVSGAKNTSKTYTYSSTNERLMHHSLKSREQEIQQTLITSTNERLIDVGGYTRPFL